MTVSPLFFHRERSKTETETESNVDFGLLFVPTNFEIVGG